MYISLFIHFIIETTFTLEYPDQSRINEWHDIECVHVAICPVLTGQPVESA